MPCSPGGKTEAACAEAGNLLQGGAGCSCGCSGTAAWPVRQRASRPERPDCQVPALCLRCLGPCKSVSTLVPAVLLSAWQAAGPVSTATVMNAPEAAQPAGAGMPTPLSGPRPASCWQRCRLCTHSTLLLRPRRLALPHPLLGLLTRMRLHTSAQPTRRTLALTDNRCAAALWGPLCVPCA